MNRKKREIQEDRVVESLDNAAKNLALILNGVQSMRSRIEIGGIFYLEHLNEYRFTLDKILERLSFIYRDTEDVQKRFDNIERLLTPTRNNPAYYIEDDYYDDDEY